MRSIARTIIVPFVFAATAVVSSGYAAPPHASCLATAPHHTRTLGPNVTSVTATSSLAYWDNDCKCYVVEIDVPSNSSPAGVGSQKTFGVQSNLNAFPGPQTKEGCESMKERAYLYKKSGNTYGLVASEEQKGDWVFGQQPFSPPGTPSSHYCVLKTTEASGTFANHSPPASGTDTYRMLRSSEHNGKFNVVSVTAIHTPNPPH